MKINFKRLVLIFLMLSITVSASSLVLQDVIWTDLVNVTVSGDTLSRSSSSPAGWVAGAFSVQKIAAGSDGYFEMTVLELNTHRFGGLSPTNTNASYESIHFAIFLQNGNMIYIGESGAHWAVSPYQSGDVVRVAREGSQIKYYKNGSLLHTSAKTSTGDLYVDTSLFSYSSGSASTIYKAQIFAGPVEINVPEPGTLGLILFGCMVLFGRFSRSIGICFF